MELRGSRMRCVLAALGALTSRVATSAATCGQGTDGASAVIGPGGGMLALSVARHWRSPPCALAKDTAISIARSSAQGPGGALVVRL